MPFQFNEDYAQRDRDVQDSEDFDASTEYRQASEHDLGRHAFFEGPKDFGAQSELGKVYGHKLEAADSDYALSVREPVASRAVMTIFPPNSVLVPLLIPANAGRLRLVMHGGEGLVYGFTQQNVIQIHGYGNGFILSNTPVTIPNYTGDIWVSPYGNGANSIIVVAEYFK